MKSNVSNDKNEKQQYTKNNKQIENNLNNECIQSVNNFFDVINKEREDSNTNNFDNKKDKIVQDQILYDFNNLHINDENLQYKHDQINDNNNNNNNDLVFKSFENGKFFIIFYMILNFICVFR